MYLFCCVIDQKCGDLLQCSGDSKGTMRVKSQCRWQGQLIFTEGHGLQRQFPVLFDKDEQLQWSNFKGSEYS